MKTALLFLFLFKIIPVAAQYCCTEVGKVLYYTTVDKKEEKTLRDSALVRDVIRENERIVIDLRWYGDSTIRLRLWRVRTRKYSYTVKKRASLILSCWMRK